MKYQLIRPNNVNQVIAEMANPNPTVRYVPMTMDGTEYGLPLVYALLRSPTYTIETGDIEEYLNSHPDLTVPMKGTELYQALQDAISLDSIKIMVRDIFAGVASKTINSDKATRLLMERLKVMGVEL